MGKNNRKVNAKQAALLILRALEARSEARGQMLSRGRFSRLALRLLWGRREWPPLVELNEWLAPAGWVMVWDGANYMGALRLSVVQDWPRVSTAGLDEELEAIDRRQFDFEKLDYLLEPEVWRKERFSTEQRQKKKKRARE
jgi:hypothetical protein